MIPVRLESAVLRARTPGGPERCRTVIIECSATSETPWEARGFQSVPPPRERRDSEPEMMLGQAMPRRGATVLVVEDESLVRKAVQHYLVNAGYRVLTASDGAEAIERWNAHGGAIDLVLTDLSLAEGATGPEIVETLRSVRPEVAVLYMSACPPELLARRGFVAPRRRRPRKAFRQEHAPGSRRPGPRQPPLRARARVAPYSGFTGSKVVWHEARGELDAEASDAGDDLLIGVVVAPVHGVEVLGGV